MPHYKFKYDLVFVFFLRDYLYSGRGISHVFSPSMALTCSTGLLIDMVLTQLVYKDEFNKLVVLRCLFTVTTSRLELEHLVKTLTKGFVFWLLFFQKNENQIQC